MKNYTFLFKPIFFIISLLFATWLVVTIEKYYPSTFGWEDSIVTNKTIDSTNLNNDKRYLLKICAEYKEEKIDSVILDRKISVFLKLNKCDYTTNKAQSY